jgi:transcriptional regulator with XRE-family HTH domain
VAYPGPDTRRERALFGAALRQARISAALTQRELASLAWLNQSTICRIERGTIGGLRYDTLMRLLFALELTDIRMFAAHSFARRRG